MNLILKRDALVLREVCLIDLINILKHLREDMMKDAWMVVAILDLFLPLKGMNRRLVVFSMG